MSNPAFYTVNYSFKVPYLNDMSWHADYKDTLITIDALLKKYVAVNNVRGIWQSSTAYALNDVVVDETNGFLYQCAVAHTSGGLNVSFAEDRVVNSTYWINVTLNERARGTWTSGTTYSVGDFVVSAYIYAVCVVDHTSGSTFSGDSSYWMYLIDTTEVATWMLTTDLDMNGFAIVSGGSIEFEVDGNGIMELLDNKVDIYNDLNIYDGDININSGKIRGAKAGIGILSSTTLDKSLYAGRFCEVYSASPLTLTLDTYTNEPFVVYDDIEIFNRGSGACTIQAESGVFVNGANGGAITLQQYEYGVLKRSVESNDHWLYHGDRSGDW